MEFRAGQPILSGCCRRKFSFSNRCCSLASKKNKKRKNKKSIWGGGKLLDSSFPGVTAPSRWVHWHVPDWPRPNTPRSVVSDELLTP